MTNPIETIRARLSGLSFRLPGRATPRRAAEEATGEEGAQGSRAFGWIPVNTLLAVSAFAIWTAVYILYIR